MNTSTIANAHAFLNTIKAVVAASALVFLMGLTSCNKSNPVSEDDTALYSMTLPDADESPSDIDDATTQQECKMNRPNSDHRRLEDFGSRFLRRALNVTDAQKTQIRAFHAQHEACFKSALAALRSSDSVIFATYKPQFASVKAELAAGTIDSATAKTQLHALSQQLRDALRNNPDREVAKAAFKQCRETFIANVRSILTPEQLNIFDQWVAMHKR